jgi:hypothetical protein
MLTAPVDSCAEWRPILLAPAGSIGINGDSRRRLVMVVTRRAECDRRPGRSAHLGSSASQLEKPDRIHHLSSLRRRVRDRGADQGCMCAMEAGRDD